MQIEVLINPHLLGICLLGFPQVSKVLCWDQQIDEFLYYLLMSIKWNKIKVILSQLGSFYLWILVEEDLISWQCWPKFGSYSIMSLSPYIVRMWKSYKLNSWGLWLCFFLYFYAQIEDIWLRSIKGSWNFFDPLRTIQPKVGCTCYLEPIENKRVFCFLSSFSFNDISFHLYLIKIHTFSTKNLKSIINVIFFILIKYRIF